METKKMTQAQLSAEQIQIKKREVKYDTRDYVINYIVQQYLEDNFYIPLDYQRNFIWNENDMCFFVESVLIGLPIPFMFFADAHDGRVEIVDGAQRVQTIVRFVKNDLQLSGLTLLSDSNGLKFKDLDISVQRRFLNTNLRVVFLDEGTTNETRQEIFKRINTGGRLATPAEIRRGASDGKFKRFLEECAKNPLFISLAPRTELTEKRFEGFEMTARFFAYLDNFNSNFQEYSGNVAIYIDNYVDSMNKKCENNEQILNEYTERFINMLSYAEKILGKRGFRKSLSASSTPRARFEALSVGIALALEENPALPEKNINNWLDGEEFIEITRSDAANNKNNLIKRIAFVKNELMK